MSQENLKLKEKEITRFSKKKALKNLTLTIDCMIKMCLTKLGDLKRTN